MTTDHLLTIPEAAVRIGCSTEAIRQRIRRGMLPSIKGNDGRVRIRLTNADIDALRAGRPFTRPSDQTSEQSSVIKALEDHVRTLHEQTERQRNDHAAEREHLLAELAEERNRAVKLAEQLRADAERQRAEHQVIVDRLLTERDRERDRLLGVIERQTEQVKTLTDQRQQPPEPSKSRWRRWFGH